MDAFMLGLMGISLLVLALSFAPWLRANFIYLVLPLNLVADSLTPFFGPDSVHTGILRALLLLAFVFVLLPRLRAEPVTLVILTTLLYLFMVIVAFSSDPLSSLEVYLRLVISMMMFPAAYYLIDSWEAYSKLATSARVSLGIVVVSFFLNQQYQVGIQEYHLDEAAFTGGAGVYPAYIVAYAGLMLPLLLRVSPSRWSRRLTIGLVGLGVLVMLLLFRRGPIVALLLGGMVMFFFGRAPLKAQVVRYGVVLLAVLMLVLPVFWGKVSALYQKRVAEGVAYELQSRGGRVAELNFVREQVAERSLVQNLFGEELFNARGKYQFTRRRTLHVDYLLLLHGAGFLGLTLFLLIYGTMAWRFSRWHRRLPRSALADELKGAFWAILLASLLLSATNQLWAITPYSFFFLCMGALTSLTRREALRVQAPPLPRPSRPARPHAERRTPQPA